MRRETIVGLAVLAASALLAVCLLPSGRGAAAETDGEWPDVQITVDEVVASGRSRSMRWSPRASIIRCR